MTFFELLADGIDDLEAYEQVPEPAAPCPAGATGRHDPHAPHVLIVHDEPDDGFDVEHPEGCPRFQSSHLGCEVHECAVEFELENVGAGEFFTHAEDGYNILRPDATILIPGRYLIEWQQERVGGGYWHPPEYNSWLQLIYPEEAHRG